MPVITETFTVPSRGIGTPDYSPQVLQEPWIATAPFRSYKTAGWIYSHISVGLALPAGQLTQIGAFTAAELVSLGIEAILLEGWVATSPNIYCRCYINDVMVCTPLGCSPVFLYPARLTDSSLPFSCHVYDTEAGQYGVICRFRKDIGRGYRVEHYLYNDDVADQTLIISGICYQRKITIT